MISFHSIAYFTEHEASGYFYNYHLSVQKALLSKVTTAHVYVSNKAAFAEHPEGWKKWFSPVFNRANRRKFWKECRALYKTKSENKRIFFLEFFGRRDFVLFAASAALFSKKSDTFWILYRDDLEIRRKKDLKMIRLLSKLLQWKVKQRFIPLTDNELLADFYQGWFGRRPIVLPVVSTVYKPVEKVHKTHLRLSWLGAPRPDKGSKEISHLVQIQDPQAKNITLEVSGATHFPPPKNQLEISLRRVFLTAKEYYDSLERSDVVLLPYDQKYARRTSGVFVEAILAGKIPVVKEGSWLSHELKRFDLTELIVDWEDPLFFTNLFPLLQNEKILARLEKMQQAYVSFHGEKNFAESLRALI